MHPRSFSPLFMTIALIDKLVQDGLLTQSDFKKSLRDSDEKIGLPEGSIFAEVA